MDVMRGVWGGTHIAGNGNSYQFNLFLNELVPDGKTPGSYVLTGYSAYRFPAEHQKRIVTGRLPLFGLARDVGGGKFEVKFMTNGPLPPKRRSLPQFRGKAVTGGPSLGDDEMLGEWSTGKRSGKWKLKHLDRRRIQEPEIDLADPSLGVYFSTDVRAHYRIESSGEMVWTAVGVVTNLACEEVWVDFPNGFSAEVHRYSDLYDPAAARFLENYPGVPPTGVYATYGVAPTGSRIPGVVGEDVYLPGYEPEAPTNVAAAVLPDNQIAVNWTGSQPIQGSFEPGNGIGWYQLDGWSADNVMVFAAAPIPGTGFKIPWLPMGWPFRGTPLSLLPDGEYSFEVSSFSVAPQGSGGVGIMCHVVDGRERVTFIKQGGVIEITGI